MTTVPKKRSIISVRRLAIVAILLTICSTCIILGRQALGGLRFRAAQEALARRDFAEARRLADQCLAIWPNDSETLMLAAQAARRGGAIDEAETTLRAAERADAAAELLGFERSLLALQRGETEAIARLYQVCVDHPTANESSLILEAMITGALRRLDLALTQTCLDQWEENCASQADRIQGWIWRGELAIRKGDVDVAADQYRRAVEAKPDDDQIRVRLAELLARHAPKEALTHLEQLTSRRRNAPDVLLYRARSHRSLGEYEKAAALLGQILESSDNDYDAILELAQIALELRQFATAESRFREALAIHPNRRDPNAGLARCLQLSGKDDEASQFRDRVAELDAKLDQRMRLLREKGRLVP